MWKTRRTMTTKTIPRKKPRKKKAPSKQPGDPTQIKKKKVIEEPTPEGLVLKVILNNVYKVRRIKNLKKMKFDILTTVPIFPTLDLNDHHLG